MKTLILENALNHLLSTHQVDISPLEGKTIRLSLQDFPLDVYFICTNNRFFVVTSSDVVDVEITLTVSAFSDLLKKTELHDMLRQDKIIIHGDVKTAQLLVDILQQLDFEEVLSQWTGDIIAHQAGKVIKHLKSSDRPISAFKDKIAAILINPKVVK
ncbi:Protein YigP (COG3165) clustered with ubiquinone biosynthetic genes [Bathymodiolus thermophilus thioautotrophic gill symbiont]|jgi:ubiquinone biosynthesis protein UbiJ|uniref:SCP2 domain-containing protein n=1 Tax=Bathymodiolus thermophilus thioautotrophic gill symbiont TaxID=2360 RepID=A0A1J5UJX0_9GAMM|nr:SCP2 sterol-binding domain-containing protein [Bathymodiolus thermophilus thioautotrophic gill symbiont]AYQ55874.1 hypothetical protein MS2017_0115 [Bathymodiolus thermophilus thioautotrophic gill symbiont]OIR24559.1 hypothetical protein BGC33_14810 [Bathymodiolus thermophilus thioautotrophic gill symbiont]CAB5496957.1 hypothetical protein THERMOT_607 [Bathymodiolus thermophilus thioautotrophic gill symbiont]CAB5499982.1 hypothetical protein THERMOS_1127 [Bathymodiolus thermophilus thioautot